MVERVQMSVNWCRAPNSACFDECRLSSQSSTQSCPSLVLNTLRFIQRLFSLLSTFSGTDHFFGVDVLAPTREMEGCGSLNLLSPHQKFFHSVSFLCSHRLADRYAARPKLKDDFAMRSQTFASGGVSSVLL